MDRPSHRQREGERWGRPVAPQPLPKPEGEWHNSAQGTSRHGERLTMIATLMRLAQNEEGATAAEYGLIAVLIALALIAALELVAS